MPIGSDDLQQRQRRGGAAARAAPASSECEEEVGVLEVAEQAEVGRDADGDQQALRQPGGLEPLDAAGEEVVEDRGDEDEAGEPGVPAGVEVEAGGQEQEDAAAVGPAQPGEAGAEEDDGGRPEQLAAGREVGPGGRRSRGEARGGVRRGRRGGVEISPDGPGEEGGARQDQKAAQPPRRHGPVGGADDQEEEQEFERTEDHDRAPSWRCRRHTRRPGAASRRERPESWRAGSVSDRSLVAVATGNEIMLVRRQRGGGGKVGAAIGDLRRA